MPTMSCQIKRSCMQSYIYPKYLIVASSNACYYLGYQLFVERSQYIRIENPLHKQSEKACMCF